MVAVLLLVNLLYAALLVAGGLVPDLPANTGQIPDVILHGTAYGLQTLLLFCLLYPVMKSPRAILVAAVCATIFGAIVETSQLMQPNRSVEFKDVIANATGACLSALAVAIIRRKRS